MRKLLVVVAMVAGVAACESATGPRAFTLGPGCTMRKVATAPVDGGEVDIKVTAHNRDCTKLNIDSLRADGWQIAWDTTWVD